MTENSRDEWQNVRLIIRVHVSEISIADVLDIQLKVYEALFGVEGAEIEITQLPLLPER